VYIFILYIYQRGLRTKAGVPLLSACWKSEYIFVYIYVYIYKEGEAEAYVPRQAGHYSLPVGKVCVYIHIDR